MRRTTRTNLMLLAMVLLLCAAVLAELKREEWLLARPLTRLDAHSVRTIAVDCIDCKPRRFVKVRGRWEMREPYALPANPETITRLLAIARAPIRKRRAATEFDPSRLGLSPPQASLALDNLHIDFGTTDAINNDRYVRLRDDILLVPDRYSAWLLASPETEIDRHLIDPLLATTSLQLDGVARDDLLPAWRSVVAQRIAPVSAGADATPDTKSHRIEIGLADGGRLAYALRRDEDGYTARRAAPALDYRLDESQVQTLIATKDAR